MRVCGLVHRRHSMYVCIPFFFTLSLIFYTLHSHSFASYSHANFLSVLFVYASKTKQLENISIWFEKMLVPFFFYLFCFLVSVVLLLWLATCLLHQICVLALEIVSFYEEKQYIVLVGK